MPDIVGIRFKRAGKVYYFDPKDVEPDVGDCVIVETERGLEAGRVVISPKQVVASQLNKPLRPVVRKAAEEDLEKLDESREREEEAFSRCQEMISELNLPMKLRAAEYNFDGTRLTFLFSAEGRVDFRELLRKLTSTFKTRVELRQVGPRDEAKIMGGVGRCGRPLCCASYLSEFDTISIRMAKEQDLPLNPMKISGVCGRLLCCLSYENEQYRSMKEILPQMGQRITTPLGPASVVGGNPVKETVRAKLESEAVVEFPISDVRPEEKVPGRRERQTRRNRPPRR